jgi:hypothetical protein
MSVQPWSIQQSNVGRVRGHFERLHMEDDVTMAAKAFYDGTSATPSAEAQQAKSGASCSRDTRAGSVKHQPPAPLHPAPCPPKDDTSDSQSQGSMSSSDDDDAQSDESDYVHVRARSSETVSLEDKNLSVARKLAQHLREQPLLPAHPLRPEESFVDVDAGIELPMWHCAFKGCRHQSNSEADAAWDELPG